MHAPIKDYKQKNYPDGNITQWFGENPELYNRWGLKGHNGIDIVAPHGTDLLCVEDGTIIDVEYNPDGYGKYVRMLSRRTEDGRNREWTYGHLSQINVVVGKKVKAGDKIGEMGNTGFVVSGATPWWKYNPFAGTHLHLGLRFVRINKSGFRYHKKSPRIVAENYDNGYKGAVNPASYFTNTTTKKQKMLTLISLMNQLVKILRGLKETN